MQVRRSGGTTSLLVAAAVILTGSRSFLTGQGGGFSTARPASATVMASWTSQWSNLDGITVTLLVLWRGQPGWFAKGPRGSGGGGGGGSGGAYRAYQTFAAGGRIFELEVDLRRKVVKILDQEISLQAANIILVDDADSASGPRIVGSQWVEPAPEGQSAGGDAISGIVKRTPALFEYLQCDLVFDDPIMRKLVPIICDQMRP